MHRRVSDDERPLLHRRRARPRTPAPRDARRRHRRPRGGAEAGAGVRVQPVRGGARPTSSARANVIDAAIDAGVQEGARAQHRQGGQSGQPVRRDEAVRREAVRAGQRLRRRRAARASAACATATSSAAAAASSRSSSSSGRPGVITVTDERMTRFWITLEQGVDFVIQCLGAHGWRRDLRAEDSQHAHHRAGEGHRAGLRDPVHRDSAGRKGARGAGVRGRIARRARARHVLRDPAAAPVVARPPAGRPARPSSRAFASAATPTRSGSPIDELRAFVE